MSNKLVVISIVALAAVALYQQVVLGRVRAASEELGRQNEQLRAELRDARKTNAAAKGPPSGGDAQGNVTTITDARPASSEPKVPPNADADLGSAKTEIQATQERVVPLRDELTRLMIRTEEGKFRGLQRLAGFSPAEAEQFRQILHQKVRRNLELEAERRARGMTTEAIEDRIAAEFTVDVRTVFGERRAQLIQRYQETQPLRAIAEELATSSFYSGTPLTAAHVEQLTDVLARQAPAGLGPVDVRKVDFETAAPQLQSILSSAQIAELREIMARPTRTPISRAR
jgi:type II secretory pathway pseudopilin PulG